MKKFLFILILLTVLYAGSEFGAKTYVEARMEDEVRASAPNARNVGATVSLPLVYAVLAEKPINTVEVVVRGADVGPFVADRISGTLQNVTVDRAELIQNQEVRVTSIGSFDGTIELTEGEVSKVLPSGFSFHFEQNAVTLEAPAGIRIRGRIQGSRDGFKFSPGEDLPAPLRLTLFRFQNVPFASCVDTVEILPGRAIVSCHVDRPPATFPPA